MTFKFECPQCGQHIRVDYADAGTNGVCPACKAAIVVPDPSFEAATSGREMKCEGPASEEQPPPIPAIAIPDHQSATHAFPNEAVPEGAPAAHLGTLKSILPLVLLIGMFGWLPVFVMPGARLVQASSGATFILTGLCASFVAVAFSYRWLRPRAVSGLSALLVFLSTAVAGVSLLLLFQWCAEFTLKRGPIVAGPATIWIWIVQFAGKCYNWSGSADLFKQIVGCVFGIGVYEELTKMLPLAVVLFTGQGKPLAGRINYRAFVALGFLSGLAFGISEALVVYAPWAQTLQIDNSALGVMGIPITSGLNRWFSCVPMHALWGAADAAVLWLLSTRLLSAKSALAKFGILILATTAMAVIHGLYDAACFRGSNAGIVLGIGSVFLVQWIVARNAVPSEPSPANSSGCERPLEAFYRLPYASALTVAIALSGFGALYFVSNPRLGAYRSVDDSSASNTQREVYRTLDGKFVLSLISSDQVEYKYGRLVYTGYNQWISETAQAKYTKQSDAIRVVFTDGRVSYFRFTQEGIQTEDGYSLLSPRQFAAAEVQKRLEQKNNEAQQARMEAEKLAKIKAEVVEKQRKEELIEASKKETKILESFKFSGYESGTYGYGITSIVLTDAGLHLGRENGTKDTIWFSDLGREAEAVNRQNFNGIYIHLPESYQTAPEKDRKKAEAIVSQINSAYRVWKKRHPELASEKNIPAESVSNSSHSPLGVPGLERDSGVDADKRPAAIPNNATSRTSDPSRQPLEVVGSTGTVREFKEGDEVRLIHNAILTFNGQAFKHATTGSRFVVVAYRPVEKRVYLRLRTSESKDVAVAVEDAAVELVSESISNPPAPTIAIANTNVADQRAMVAKVAAEVARLRKNANVIDRPNRLFPNDTSNQQRAAQLRAQADALEQQAGLPPSSK